MDGKAARSEPLLEVTGLSVAFPTDSGWQHAVEDVSFDLRAGQMVGLVGESGSGKSVTSQAVMGLIPALGGRITAGSVRFDGEELVGMDEKRLRDVRGNGMGMVFQQAIRSLNPAFTVGDQIAETVRRHRRVGRKEAWGRAVKMLDRVRIKDAARRAHDYPHMFSGGQCQRIMIAMALACEPRLIIADEPTTALDVTVQATILEMLREIQSDTGIGVLFISHDLAVIAQMCERVVVMYAGQIVEQGTAESVFFNPRHPYTAGLLGAIPRPGAGGTLEAIPGTVPRLTELPPGCRFGPRCAHALGGLCDTEVINLESFGSGESVRCVRAAELSLVGVVDE